MMIGKTYIVEFNVVQCPVCKVPAVMETVCGALLKRKHVFCTKCHRATRLYLSRRMALESWEEGRVRKRCV